MLFILYHYTSMCHSWEYTISLPQLSFLLSLFKTINVEKKDKERKTPFPNKKVKKAGTEQCSGMKCCPAVLGNQCHLEYWAPTEPT